MLDDVRLDASPKPPLESSLRVCLLVGDLQTRHCGVKDYTYRLAEALAERGIAAEVHAPSDWSLKSFGELRRRLRAAHFNVLHVQYPSIGFRYSLLPHMSGLTGIAAATCVTLHEYSRLPLTQRLSTYLFSLSTDRVLFTTDEERASFAFLMRGGDRLQVIPIASNVPEAPQPKHTNPTVLYFGQLRPDKGIEAFLDLARLSLESLPELTFQVIGANLPRHAEYLEMLRRHAPDNVNWIIGSELTAIALMMSSSLAAYLPFPDGASYRRGSLVASLVNALPVISTRSRLTPGALSNVILEATTPQQALVHLKDLKECPERRRAASVACRSLGRQFCWSSVAEAHHLLYNRLCKSKRRLQNRHGSET